MELKSYIRRLIFKTSFLVLGFGILLWLSVFFYGLLYYIYIPAVAHVKPVHLRYASSCSKERFCSFPYDNITLVETGRYELLASGQAYAIELRIEMPESERNLNQGMFMVRLDMLSQTGEVLKSSSRPAILRYRSPLFKTVYTLFFIPALLFGTTEEKQSLSIPLFERFVEDTTHPTHFAFVEIQAEIAEVYSSSLRIHAQFTGLRYMMYYWPLLSAVVGIGTNFAVISIMVIFIWVRHFMSTPRYANVTLMQQGNVVEQTRGSAQQNIQHTAPKTGIQRQSLFREARQVENLSGSQPGLPPTRVRSQSPRDDARAERELSIESEIMSAIQDETEEALRRSEGVSAQSPSSLRRRVLLSEE